MDKSARQPNPPTPNGNNATRRSTKALAHELRVHQIELETQNEELRRTQLDLAAARDRFVDLYDFAPVGYFTLDRDGKVVEANLTGAAMLGEERESLLRRRFVRFVAAADGDRWHRHLQEAMQCNDPQPIEVTLQPRAGALFSGQLNCLRVAPSSAEPAMRVALTDITARKLAEIDRRIAITAVETRESERRRVARELHEELGQRLSAVKMNLTQLRPTADIPGAARKITEMLEMLDESIATVRRITTDLRPLMLDDLGLNTAIDWLAHEWAQRVGLRVTLRLDESNPPLGERASVAAYRLLQDTLSRIGRHANATHAHIEMLRHPGELILAVENNGTGRIDSAEATASLRDQLHVLGGELDLTDLSAGSQRITFRLPLRRADDGKGMQALSDQQ